MRKFSMIAVGLLFVIAATAQDIDNIRNMWMINQNKKAKEDIDKAMANTKFSNKPESWLLKSAIYSGVSSEPDMAAQAEGLLKEAWDAFNNYRQKDPDLKLLKGENSYYVNVPGAIYGSYFNNGIAGYNKKDWAGSFKNFKMTVDISDFLITNKLSSLPIDTTAILLAGATAQNAEMADEAAKYYARLAEAKIKGEDNEFIYPYLVEHYMKKNDNTNKEKFLAIGKELYPKNTYWCNIPLIEAGEDTLKIFDAYEQMIKNNCADHSTYYDYAREMYNYAYFGKNRPSDMAKYEIRMVEMLKKSLELKETPEANMLICRIYFMPINDLIDAYNAIKGTKPEDVKKRNDVGIKLNAKYEEMIPYANSAFEYYDSKASLKPGEKANFKIITNMIVEYWVNKKDKDKTKKYEDKMKEIE